MSEGQLVRQSLTEVTFVPGGVPVLSWTAQDGIPSAVVAVNCLRARASAVQVVMDNGIDGSFDSRVRILETRLQSMQLPGEAFVVKQADPLVTITRKLV
jgi:hypothetical protein